MKVISLGMGQKIFEDQSLVSQRQVEYGRLFDELHIVVFSPDGSLKEKKLAENVFLYPTNTRARALYFVDFLRIVKRIIKKIGKDNVVITVQDPFEIGIIGLILKLFYKLPLQVQVHTDFANRYFITHSALNFLRFPIALVVLSFADSVRVVSERIAKSIYSLSKNITVLPISQGLPLGNVDPKGRSWERKRPLNILTVCRLEKEKNIETAIMAFKKVLDEGIQAQFVIVGDGSQKKNLLKLCEDLNISDKVVFAGWQNNLENYYKDADIYISTSLYEGYGISVVEAAHFGLPLVLSDVGVANEFFFDGEEAFILKPKDTDAFARAMIKLSKNPELIKTMGEKARDSVKSRRISREEYLQKYKINTEEAITHFKNNKSIFGNILVRYLIAGFSAAGTNIGLLYIFTDILNIWYLYSSILSFLIAIWVSFFLQKLWTFGDKKVEGVRGQFLKYMAVAIAGILINTLSMLLLVDALHLWYILAQIITGGIIAAINFLMYKFFIFNRS